MGLTMPLTTNKLAWMILPIKPDVGTTTTEDPTARALDICRTLFGVRADEDTAYTWYCEKLNEVRKSLLNPGQEYDELDELFKKWVGRKKIAFHPFQGLPSPPRC